MSELKVIVENYSHDLAQNILSEGVQTLHYCYRGSSGNECLEDISHKVRMWGPEKAVTW